MAVGVESVFQYPGPQPTGFTALIGMIQRYFIAMTNVSSSQNYFHAENVFNDNVISGDFVIDRFWAYIVGILPELLGLLGIIIGIRIAFKLFKRFSR